MFTPDAGAPSSSTKETMSGCGLLQRSATPPHEQ
jgi:hypothetical protein